MLSNFDANLKVFPPIRSKKMQKEFIKNIKTGNIDAISSSKVAGKSKGRLAKIIDTLSS